MEGCNKKKALGNNEYKKGNYGAAIAYYTAALRCALNEQVLSNRAMTYLAVKEYKLAVDDCKNAIRINPEFPRTYKRLFKAELALGNIEAAKSALATSVELEPNDPTHKMDQNSLTTVIHQ